MALTPYHRTERATSAMTGQPAVVANTDKMWFDHFARTNGLRAVDEVNFWRPASQKRFRALPIGGPFFLRLKAPYHAIAGFGFFAVDCEMSVSMAWEIFEERNGDPTRERFMSRIGSYHYLRRGPESVPLPDRRLTCLILRDAVFLPERDWIPWGSDAGWSDRIVDYKLYDLTEGAGRRLAGLLHQAHPAPVPDLLDTFVPVAAGQRAIREERRGERLGQGTFRVRVLSAYASRCAVTGEHALPVLEAAHIQPYQEPASNHIQNGILLRTDLHRLYDLGYITITPDLRLEVSRRLRDEFDNGKTYYAMTGIQVSVPSDASNRPSRAALEWHVRNVFR